jgi:uncharacterized phage protein (TIGR02220 family)
MDWASERYVRLFVRDTVGWRLLPWQSKALLPLLLRKVYPTGDLDLEGEGVPALAALVELPLELVEPGLAGLVQGRVVVVKGSVVSVRNFLPAQTTPSSSRTRKAIQRDREEAEERHATSRKKRQRDIPSRPVTRRPAIPPTLPIPTLPVPAQPTDPDPGSISEERSPVGVAAAQVLARLNEIRGTPERGYSTSPELEARIRDGVPVEDLVLVVEHHAARLLEFEGGKYYRPATLFGPKNFAKYLDEAKAGPPRPAATSSEPPLRNLQHRGAR